MSEDCEAIDLLAKVSKSYDGYLTIVKDIDKDTLPTTQIFPLENDVSISSEAGTLFSFLKHVR